MLVLYPQPNMGHATGHRAESLVNMQIVSEPVV